MNLYEIRDQGELIWFLDIRMFRDRPTQRLWLTLDAYIDKIVAAFNLDHAPKTYTPLSSAPS